MARWFTNRRNRNLRAAVKEEEKMASAAAAGSEELQSAGAPPNAQQSHVHEGVAELRQPDHSQASDARMQKRPAAVTEAETMIKRRCMDVEGGRDLCMNGAGEGLGDGGAGVAAVVDPAAGAQKTTDLLVGEATKSQSPQEAEADKYVPEYHECTGDPNHPRLKEEKASVSVQKQGAACGPEPSVHWAHPDPHQLRKQEVNLDYGNIYKRLMAVPTDGGDETTVCSLIHAAFSDKELRHIMVRNQDRSE